MCMCVQLDLLIYFMFGFDVFMKSEFHIISKVTDSALVRVVKAVGLYVD